MQLEKLRPGLQQTQQVHLLNELPSGLIFPYVIMTIVLLALGFMIRYSKLPDVKEQEEDDTAGTEIRRKSIFRFPCLILGLVISLAAIFISGKTSVWFSVLPGLSNGLLWPSIWALALDGLGKFTKQGSALLIMGVVGGATTSLLYGYLSDYYNPQRAYWVLIPCYFFILFFSVKGYKIGKLNL
ncbi:MAG: hypothetical protein Q8939_10260 [Bacteroidota bacterium]|nr:hypothetical protein [Bacteroidota bacterium]MDP4214284.1 hypothetical protein [Bacteroidota bacterium]